MTENEFIKIINILHNTNLMVGNIFKAAAHISSGNKTQFFQNHIQNSLSAYIYIVSFSIL